jgi:hypothetical protein
VHARRYPILATAPPQQMHSVPTQLPACIKTGCLTTFSCSRALCGRLLCEEGLVRANTMAHVFNRDGTTRPASPRTDHSKRGNRQEYSIFGWANEPASLREARTESQRAQMTPFCTRSKILVAGVKTTPSEYISPHIPYESTHDMCLLAT